MQLNVGIIGCGGIANGKHLPSLQKIEEVNIVAFCDIDVEKAEVAADYYGTEQAKAYADYKELLKDETIDVIHVCTQNSSHKELTIASLESSPDSLASSPNNKLLQSNCGYEGSQPNRAAKTL